MRPPIRSTCCSASRLNIWPITPRLREAGDIVTNGPVSDQPDGSLRGLTFYRTGSLAHARQLAEADPAVRAGRLAVEIMTWYCPPGTMSQPGRTVSLP
jgi:uncharacterized protein